MEIGNLVVNLGIHFTTTEATINCIPHLDMIDMLRNPQYLTMS